MNIIKLKRASDCWTATFIGPQSQKVFDLFGSTTIPTGFTNAASLAMVRETVQRAHPGYTIIARHEG